MEIIKNYSNNFLNQTETKLQSSKNTKTESIKKSKAVDYFDYIYSYPPKIKIKWDHLDDLKNDVLSSSKKSLLNFPIIHLIDDWIFIKPKKELIFENYSKSQYFDGFFDKINSSNFFLSKTKEIQSSLSNIPVFVVSNGQGEIILSKPSNFLSSKTFEAYTNEKLYDFCGAFDSRVEKKSELGLFFMNYSDAEKYLKEVARFDFEGTKTVGLSIHCIGLNSAYKITREYHPGIDFRFVPDFNEVKELLENDIGKSDMLIENEQQQLRFRFRPVNKLPVIGVLGKYAAPYFSFLQRNEYFKGVPIYIVQITEKSQNPLIEQYFNLAGGVDVVYNRCIQFFDFITGFGHNWIIEGSIKDVKNFDEFENYIFFEKNQAIKFCQKNGKKIIRYKGGRGKSIGSIIRKPRILVYNLEDFLEDWEDTITGELTNAENLFKSKSNQFVSPTLTSTEVDNLSQDIKNNPIQKFSQTISIKFKVFKRAVGVFFSI